MTTVFFVILLLATTESLFSTLDDVPNVLISRDLRRGLVL
ncbi:MAG: hypothetical protein ACI96M_003830, partial [Candidatus Azotimanducaceae bacterium]